MQLSRKSFSNLRALASGDFGDSLSGISQDELPPASEGPGVKSSTTSVDSEGGRKQQRVIFVSNRLPLLVSHDASGELSFSWDEDALIRQAALGLAGDASTAFVGCLPGEVLPEDQERVSSLLMSSFACYPVWLGEELSDNFYARFCKQELWPLLHYFIPLDPASPSRFDPNLWSSYVRANMAFANRLVEVLGSLEDDRVWIHDYHLLVLPSLLRKRFHRIKVGVFLHSPFPSSEVFRTFPRREEIMRSMLNADLVGFHTFDYARHFLSCCSRMLGLEHKTHRGSIVVEYYGRDVGIKIMPTGIAPARVARAVASDEAQRVGRELTAKFAGRTVLLGIDDLDVFKGIELRLAAFRQLLAFYPEWRGRVVLVQVASAPRAGGREVEALRAYCAAQVAEINAAFGAPGKEPVLWIERPLGRAERAALLAAADVVVVTATRDGMNLLPYEYVVARQGIQGAEELAAEAAKAAPGAGGAGGAAGQVASATGYAPFPPGVLAGTALEAPALSVAQDAAAGTPGRGGPSGQAGGSGNSGTGPGNPVGPVGSLSGVAPVDASTSGLSPPPPPPPSSSLSAAVPPPASASGAPATIPTTPAAAASAATAAAAAPRSMLVVSEFVGCSPSLSGAIRVNPWSVEAVRDAIYSAIRLPPEEARVRHDKHWRYVKAHTAQFWARSFVADLGRFTANHAALQCFDLGFALNTFRMVALTSNFRRLPADTVARAYARARHRLFLLDHDGTLTSGSSPSSAPSPDALAALAALSADPKNDVYVISGRSRDDLARWFGNVPNLGLAAEHGFYWRRAPGEPWRTQDPEARFDWKDIVAPILAVYAESTDGSWIEVKESALVWHYADADPDFGSWQAKELLDHLEGVLSNEPVEVVAGHAIVEVKPQGVSKGRIVERVLHDALVRGRTPDFVVCIGDDRSDEDMFDAVDGIQFSPHMPSEVFAVTVGQKPSKAPYYVNDPADVLLTLRRLGDVAKEEGNAATGTQGDAKDTQGDAANKGRVTFSP